MLDCRNPNELVLGEIESWRVQKFVFKTTTPGQIRQQPG